VRATFVTRIRRIYVTQTLRAIRVRCASCSPLLQMCRCYVWTPLYMYIPPSSAFAHQRVLRRQQFQSPTCTTGQCGNLGLVLI
jgi:hypothetical protein